jgi:Na+-transporting NADH:ubiquinone oxidoreductase subunit C
LRVVKGGAPEGDSHAVDAISGATITSTGLEKMVNETLKKYEPYLIKLKKQV